MQVIPLTWKTIGQNHGFRCFIRGCKDNAEYMVRIKKGEMVIQLCVCGKCLHDSPADIMQNTSQINSTLHSIR